MQIATFEQLETLSQNLMSEDEVSRKTKLAMLTPKEFYILERHTTRMLHKQIVGTIKMWNNSMESAQKKTDSDLPFKIDFSAIPRSSTSIPRSSTSVGTRAYTPNIIEQSLPVVVKRKRVLQPPPKRGLWSYIFGK